MCFSEFVLPKKLYTVKIAKNNFNQQKIPNSTSCIIFALLCY